MQTNFAENGVNVPGLDQARSRFGLLLGRVFRQWRRQVDLSFKDLGLSDATRAPLLALYTHGTALRQKDLADALSLESSSLVRVLAQLRQSQLVDWECDPADRRTKCIALTARGRETAALILVKSLEIEQAILADLTTQEQDVTRRVLEQISTRFTTL